MQNKSEILQTQPRHRAILPFFVGLICQLFPKKIETELHLQQKRYLKFIENKSLK